MKLQLETKEAVEKKMAEAEKQLMDAINRTLNAQPQAPQKGATDTKGQKDSDK